MNMADMVTAIYKSSKSIFCLIGSSNTIDVKQYLINNGIDLPLSDLTDNNFLVVIKSANSTSTRVLVGQSGTTGSVAISGITVTKSFDSTNGILTISGTSQSLSFYQNTASITATQEIVFDVYLRK